jgi:hypothetical protein
MVKTNGKIRLNVSSQPDKGELSEPAKGLLRYVPFVDFESGRDSFTLSVFGENDELLLSDTVVIIVEDDSTSMPCGYYAVDDYVYSSTSTVSIDVLANDLLCGDSADVKLEIYRPDNSFPPFSGTASVVDNRILYQASSDVVTDSVIYKVSRKSDNTMVGFAMVHITIDASCVPFAFDDNYFRDTTRAVDTLDLFVLRNDEFCGNTPSSIMLHTDPHHGDASVQWADEGSGDIWLIKYAYQLPGGDSTAHILDSLQYKFCIGSQCYTGKARIRIN